MVSEVPDVADALDALNRDVLAVTRAANQLRAAEALPAYPSELEALIEARNRAILVAASAGASISQLRTALKAHSGQRARQMLDLAPLPESAQQEALHDWGVALRRRRSDGNLNRGQVAVLSMMSRGDVIALEDGERKPTPEEVELLRAALSMTPQNRAARLRVVREQQVGPRPLPRTGGPRKGPLNDEQEQHLDRVRQVLATLQPLLDKRDALLTEAQESGIPMSRIATEVGMSPADVRRSIDVVQRRKASTLAG